MIAQALNLYAGGECLEDQGGHVASSRRRGAPTQAVAAHAGLALPLFLGLFFGFGYIVRPIFSALINLVHPGLSYG